MNTLNYIIAFIVWFMLITINCLPEEFRKEHNNIVHLSHGAGLMVLFMLSRRIGNIEHNEYLKNYKSYINLRLQCIKNIIDDTIKDYRLIDSEEIEEKLHELSNEIQDTKEGL